MTKLLVFSYIAMIVVANWTVAAFGPSVAILNAFLLIGPVMTIRDVLHRTWRDDTRTNMAALIAVASILSWALNPASGTIAFASFVAFAISETLDYLVYAGLSNRGFVVRSNASNLVGSVVDSLVFMTLAFGVFLPSVFIGQVVAKVVGGFIYSLIRWERAEV